MPFAVRYFLAPVIGVVCVWAIFLGAGIAWAEEAQNADGKKLPPIAFAARIVGNKDRFRLLVDFDKTVQRDIAVLDNPRRIIVNLEEVVFSLGDQLASPPSDLVRNVRFGSIAQGRSRMVISLNEPVEVLRRSFVHLKDQNRFRLILDVVGTSEEKFRNISSKDEARLAKRAASLKGDRIVRPKAKRKSFTVVIDPGHGGIDGGATGQHKSVEKNITLAFSKSLQKQLSLHPLVEVLLTRDTDIFLSLRDRLDFARIHKADLKISVHADSLAQKNIRGATIYTLSKEGSDSLSRVLAAKQNRSDLVAGLAIPKVDDSATDILIDLTRRETEAFSRRLADLIIAQLKRSTKLINNPHRSADFFVLKAPEIPSVLLELGYLSNDEDEKQMQSPEWRERTAKQVADAVLTFLEPRMER